MAKASTDSPEEKLRVAWPVLRCEGGAEGISGWLIGIRVRLSSIRAIEMFSNRSARHSAWARHELVVSCPDDEDRPPHERCWSAHPSSWFGFGTLRG